MTPEEQNIAERLHELIELQLENRLEENHQRELSDILRDYSWTHELYVEFIQDTASLRWWSASVLDSDLPGTEIVTQPVTEITGRRRSRRLVSVLAALAASLLVVAAAGLISHFDRKPALPVAENGPPANHSKDKVATAKPPAPAAQESPTIAVVTRLRGVEWGSDGSSIKAMSRLAVGQQIRFAAGEMEIIFDQAVQLVVRGPAQFEVRSPHEVYSTAGVLAARVGKAGIGFTIETPAGRITDLGTEFGVAVGDHGATDVAVFRGAVDLTYGPRGNILEPSVSRRLVQGQGLSLDSDGHMKRIVAIDDDRFPSVDVVANALATKRSSLISDVRDNVRDGVDAKFYRIVPGGLKEDAQAFVDREHQWNGMDASGIPPVLLGADYVMPFNDDKQLRTLNVTLNIGRPSRLFVFLSDVAKVPDWLTKDFQPTDLVIGLDESAEHSNPAYKLEKGPGKGINTRFTVWSRDIPKPRKITLGSIEQGKRAWGFCMYGMAAVPLEQVQEKK